MNNLTHTFREYPAVAGLAFFALITALLGTFFTVAILKSGGSLKPLIFVGGFFAIVGGPQAAVHLLDAWMHRKAVVARDAQTGDAAVKSIESVASTPALRPVAWDVVFGPKADPMLITDAKHGLVAIFRDAEEAKLSFAADGESALAARFAGAEVAQHALNVYGRFFGFKDAAGSDAAGWTTRRYAGQGEWNHVVVAGNELYAWTAATREAVVANRERALGALPASDVSSADATAGSGDNADASKRTVSTRLAGNTPVMITMVVVNVLLATFWFFKGSAWAARVPAQPTNFAVDASALSERLRALNQIDGPVQVTWAADRRSIEVTWRYADARWIDLARVHQLTRIHKLVLSLDGDARKVRVREYWSAFDASAGVGGANVQWTMATGMEFFAFEHTRVIGAQLETSGQPTGAWSSAYTFNLQELKRPVIDLVTESGWTWQPVMWNAPAAFRWLTE